MQEAIREMWSRMQPLEQRGFHPISEVEIVDATKKTLIQTFQLTDPEFQAQITPDLKEEKERRERARQKDREHAPERKDRYAYLARIRLEG